jgi:PglZ domain
MSLTTPQIKAQLARVLDSDPSARAVAIRATVKQPWPSEVSVHGKAFVVCWCESSLALREALCELAAGEPAAPDMSGLVLITPLATPDVAEDIAARLARARVFQPEGWDIVRTMFQAGHTDARLGRFAWMPQALIEAAAQGDYPPVPSGFLDLETAWRHVLERCLGLPEARPDAVSLLGWATSPDASLRLNLLPAAMRASVLDWLAQAAGSVGTQVMGCVATARLGDALPLGLVCAVVFALDGEGQVALGQAAIRLERYVNDQHVGIKEGREWASAAQQTLAHLPVVVRRAVLDRADALLHDLRIADWAHLSDGLPSGLAQRLNLFAQALLTQVAAPDWAALQEVELCADRVLRHHLLAELPARAERVVMARRLARWLLSPLPQVNTLPDGAAWQADQGAYVDWARFRLLGGDELPQVSEAYAACRRVVMARRHGMAQSFALTLAAWNAHPSRTGRVVAVEHVLGQVLAPLAARRAVLLLVMDGLSLSIFRELFAQPTHHGWAEWVPEAQGQPCIGVAVLPTVTHISRASLLCGRLTQGTQAQEKPAFATHPELVAVSPSERPPRLFHKGDLADDGHLAPEVRAALADPKQQVVGVVYNAVDDHLSGPDQLHQRWALEDLRLLLPLLHEAHSARRVVIVTADHGHLLEDGTVPLPHSSPAGGDRWRAGDTAIHAQELALSGPRVLSGEGSPCMVGLWSENSRYGSRKNGYHGGLSPQEVIVPLSVLAPLGESVPGWCLAPPHLPEWWELPPLEPTAPAVAAPVVAVRSNRKKPAQPEGQAELFAPQEAPAPAPPPTAPAVAQDWVAELLASPVYVSQRQLAARVALPDATMRQLLEALAQRGGKLSRTALANRLAQPEVRMGGLLSAARRVLNVDQATVLSMDDSTGLVTLNLALLHQQFQLPSSGGH